MLRDVFYYGDKPNAHPREKFAKSLDDARQQATTEHFWIINEFCDYKDFDWDFDFELLHDSDVWAVDHNNVWPSLYQKDSGTWLCPKVESSIVVYRADVEPLKRKNILSNNWKIEKEVDVTKFDFGWHPDPADPPYIYRWGCKYFPVEIQSFLEYHTPGATSVKYLTDTVELLPEHDRWVEYDKIDTTRFDFSWRPDPREPPFIYVWGNKFVDGRIQSTIEYHAPNAIQKKYMDEPVEVLPLYENWVEKDKVDPLKFDFSWRPNPTEPPYIYIWGNKFIPGELQPTLEYHTPGATEKKYMAEPVEVLPLLDCWTEYQPVDKDSFDMTWRPDPREPPFIYVWGNKYIPGELMPTLEFTVPGATLKKYIQEPVPVLPHVDRINIMQKLHEKHLDTESECFNISWRPDPRDPPFIYVWGNKYIPGEVKPTLEYRVPGATKRKYMTELLEVEPEWHRWVVKIPIDKQKNTKNGFDFSWRPDPNEPPYIYTWGNKYINAEDRPTLEYHVEGATDRKYMGNTIEILPDWDRWRILKNVDKSSFDFSWMPDPKEPPFIYRFGNQHYDARTMPTIEYHTPGSHLGEYKYIDDVRAELLPNPDKFEHYDYVYGLDYSWVPNPNDPPYIYVWGNQWNKPEDKASVKFVVPGATEYKYMEERVTRKPVMDNWIIPPNVDTTGFDFSWEPNPNDPPYIYQFGTQWQKTGGPRYVIAGATEVKYVDTLKAKALPDKTRFQPVGNFKIKDFDYSWHPDSTDQPYIYVFGNKYYNAEKMPTVKYVVPGATEIKYINDVAATLEHDKANFKINIPIDETKFDFAWLPDPNDPPYIYVFGNQWNEGTVEPTVEYHAEGATEKKYINFIKATILPNMSDNWDIPDYIDKDSFDFSWRPDPREPAYIYEFPTQHQKTGGPRYVVPGATEIKYIDFQKSKRLPNKNNWEIPNNVNVDNFDFSWHPDDSSPPYIYEFGTQWQPNGGPRYIVKGATEVKCIEGMPAKALPRPNDPNWHTVEGVEIEDFDYTWYPNPNDPPYIYVFGNQFYKAEIMPSMEYHVPGAKEYKYINTVSATLKADKSKFTLLHLIDESKFDFSWKPNPKDPPYIYVFGNQWHDAVTMPTILYEVKGATEYKYIDDIKAILAHNKENWHVDSNIDDSKFDYSWVPNPNDPGYIYEFGTQWQKTGGPRYIVPNATEVKYIDTFKAKRLPDMSNWKILPGIDVSTFDFSWHPDSTEPERIYQFGTLENDNDGPRYIFTSDKTKELEIVRLLRVNKEEHTTEIKISKYVIQTTLDDLVKDHPNEIFWALNKNIDYTNFDFTWRPSIEQARYVHVFGSPDYPITHTYFVSATMYLQGNKDFNYVEKDKKLESSYLAKLFKHHDMFYIDRGNIESGSRFDQLQKLYPNIQKTRFTNSFVDTINRCIKKSTTPLCWILNSELDYTGFNFEYYPTQWQMKMIHIFGTQWSHWGTTVLVNCETFPEYTKYVKILEHLQNINFVKDRKAKATNNLYDIYLVDHGNPDIDDIKLLLETKSNGKPVTVIKLEDTYFNTIKTLLKSLPDKKEHYIWLCNSVCDYTDFDFSYICDPFARDNLHVFPTENQKYGDTFFIDVNSTKALIDDMTDIEDYKKLNFNYHQRAKRLVPPKFVTTDDSHANHIKYDFEFPYAIYCTEDIEVKDEEPIALWNKETKNILVTTTGATRIIVPKEAKSYIKNELYDYPYIKTVSKVTRSKPLDIVYLSNGEKEAEINYEHLLRCTKNAKNRIVRVDGVNGRVQAYHAALEASETAWAFTVFAKLKVNESFDWNWQPDRLQNPKHYIFNAINPLNGLIYGHQAMIAYNKKLVLANNGLGLDFTLDDPHESVDIISGTANFNTDEYSTWRTAFREVIKLQSAYDDISKQRLKTWLLDAKGKYSKQCLLGSFDAVEYYKSVNGDIDKLKLSYEWDWLQDYYNKKYK